ncbi:methyltransferase family protein [Dyella sp. 20L07]|uniref:methyltransferase family protein n=1 Tax=Dyella sp. 20L07 TaxID=3384240 RepID=UPI003D2A131E
MPKIPPPVLAVSLALLMWTLSRFTPPAWPPATAITAVALLLAVTGTVIDVSAKRLFVRVGTTINPVTPGAASCMVREGVYRWTRNPMYLGRTMQLTAMAIYLASWVGVLGVLMFAIYLDRYQILREGRALEARFASEFRAYKASVRRWI